MDLSVESFESRNGLLWCEFQFEFLEITAVHLFSPVFKCAVEFSNSWFNFFDVVEFQNARKLLPNRDRVCRLGRLVSRLEFFGQIVVHEINTLSVGMGNVSTGVDEFFKLVPFGTTYRYIEYMIKVFLSVGDVLICPTKNRFFTDMTSI